MADRTVGERNEERKRELDAARRELESAMARFAAAELARRNLDLAAILRGGRFGRGDAGRSAADDGAGRGAARVGDGLREGRVGTWRVSGLRRTRAAVAARAGRGGDGGRSRGDGDGALRVSEVRS